MLQKVESVDWVKVFECSKYNENIFIYVYVISQLRENTRMDIKNIWLAGNSVFHAYIE